MARRITKNDFLLIVLHDSKVKETMLDVFVEHGYITPDKNLTEKAFNVINKNFDELPLTDKVYTELANIFKQGTANSYKTTLVHYQRMMKQFCNKDTQHLFTESNILKAAYNWTKKVQYIGELKYFFHKDKTSRCFDNLVELEQRRLIEPKEFKER